MQADFKNRLVKKVYNTDDIIRTVVETYNQSWQQCRELTDQLRGATEEQSARNIWQYVIDHCYYLEDGSQHQWVKTPARLIADGCGDCKSMAIFCASCCSCLGIDCMIRFVSFGTSDVRHVYVVTSGGFNIDPVEYFQNGRNFNEVTNFTYSMDKPIKNGLAVLSGIGATEDAWSVWMDGTSFIDNTVAANYLYCELDSQMTNLKFSPDDLQTIRNIDIIIVAMTLYADAEGSEANLDRAAHLLQDLADGGWFDRETKTDDASRTAHLQSVLDEVDSRWSGDLTYTAEGDLYDWFITNVADEDYNDASAAQREALQQSVSGVGEVTNQNELIAKMKKSAPFFFYLFLTDEQINQYKKKVPKIVYKRQMERNVYDSWVTTWTGVFNEQTIYTMLKTGSKETFGYYPDEWMKLYVSGQLTTEEIEVLNKAAGGSISGAKIGGEPITLATLGSLLATIAKILGIVLSIVTAIGAVIQAILSNKAAKTEKEIAAIEYANNKLLAESSEGAATTSEFESLFGGSSSSSSSSTTTSTSSMVWLLAGLALLLVFGSGKKKHHKK